jgi:hypothetical protein
VFAHSLLFPLALTLIGLGIVGAGIWWRNNERRVATALRAYLPAALREMLQSRHEGFSAGP